MRNSSSACGTFSNFPLLSPGDYLRPDEDEVEGLRERMDKRLAPDPNDPSSYGPIAKDAGGDWEIGDILSQWWRPAFETFIYPYIPPHVTKPKECKRLYLITMPTTSTSSPAPCPH